ncbi:MAG TPA: LamG-like jellyroll fold domain-containing protein, partial [Candidatus Acidoferrum sp.]|nr:LamG-like jellyroll fold domain-containing protein [Candidatus Acidoferrum sp.]
MTRKTFSLVVVAVSLSFGKSTFGQVIPDVTVTGPALAANVHGSYSSVSTPSSPTVVNAPVVGNGDLALMIGGPSASLSFCVGKSDFWGVEHGVIMPVGSLVLSAPALSGSSYSLVENVGAATVTGNFTSGSSGLSLTSWIATSQNTAFIQLTNTGSQPLTLSSKLLDGFGTAGNPGTLGYSTNSTWLNVSPDAVSLEIGNHLNIGSSAPLQGRIADLQVFNQALSAAQLNALETPGAVPSVLRWTATNTGSAALTGTASLGTSDPHGGSVVLTGDAGSEVALGVMCVPQTQFTVSAWVKLAAINTTNESCIFAGLVSHGTSGYPFMRGLKLVVLSNGKLSAALNASGGIDSSATGLFTNSTVNAYSATSSGSLPTNQWIQTAVTYDGYTMTIYTNGIAAGLTANFPVAADVMGWNKTAIHLGDTNAPFHGCAPQGVLMQSVFGVAVTGNSNTLTFTVPAGGQAAIALAAVTDRNTNNFLAAAQQQSQQANVSTMNSLLQQHNQSWSNFWSKSFIQIGDPQIQNNWYASLYLLACCSASNCPPPGLWGNFISSTGMYWEGDYTLDYNVQATFWVAYACNHPELADNYDNMLLDHISRGQATAQHYGCQGIYLYTHLIPVTGWSDDGYTFWSQKSDALFAAVNCAMRWRYLRDTNYAAKIYPFLKGVSDFWDNYLVLNNNQYVDN